jgi:5-oxoprolinase (ATP-hydrolysing)
MTNSRLTDPEILELRYPVFVELFCIRQASGGDGKWKGGDGVIRKIRFREPMTVSILANSRKIAPFGLQGGRAGQPGKTVIERIGRQIKELESCATKELRGGEAIIIETPGGGGFGNSDETKG